MLDRIYEKAADGDYYGSCVRFLRDVERYAPTAKKGPGVVEALILLVISVLAGRIIVFFMTRNQGGSVAAGVNDYFAAGNTQEIIREDRFVNRMVTRRRIERKDDDDGPFRMGGSSVHHSSGGTTHGGGRRSF